MDGIETIAVPSLNTLAFWVIPEEGRYPYHGTPIDQMTKFKWMKPHGVLDQGFECYVTPSICNEENKFEDWFYEEAKKLPYVTLHIGDHRPEFITEDPETPNYLKAANDMMDKMGATKTIIHAHHFKHNRSAAYEIFKECFPGKEILIENNGFDDEWGHSFEGLTAIFEDCLDFKLCFDIDHFKDFPKYKFQDFLDQTHLVERVSQIHYSYSTRAVGYDPYVEKGYLGYGPYHALWSIIGHPPSDRTLNWVKQYPNVCEGVVPREDKELKTLKQELDWIR